MMSLVDPFGQCHVGTFELYDVKCLLQHQGQEDERTEDRCLPRPGPLTSEVALQTTACLSWHEATEMVPTSEG